MKTNTKFHSKKIIIVEDSTFCANIYRVRLLKEGFDVKTTADGNEALKILTESTPDIILLDLILPDKDGFDVLAEIKKDKKWQKIPVLVASELGQKEDIDKALALGANDYIVKKDLSLNKLVEKIKTLIK